MSAAASAGDSVGVVSAFDLNDDAVTYSITAGNEAGKFRFDSSTGEITTTGPPGSPVGTTYTLTAGAADGVSGSTTVTVTVTVVEITCSGGIVVPYPGNESGLVSDCEVLLGLRDTLAGSATLNWSVDSPIADWEGVFLRGSPLRVTGLRLAGCGIACEIAPLLPAGVSLSSNELTGEIPPELGSLAYLQELDLRGNELTGEIPPELGSLAYLQELDLRDNKLSGEIPAELGSLTYLQELDLSRNRLTGEIPPELGDLANLRELYLHQNHLSGEIPPELGDLANLLWLDLSQNHLSGGIPPELGDLANLQALRLGLNWLSGAIPPELGSLSNLEALSLIYNRLTGEIPAELGGLANLRELYLHQNHLSGEIPLELGSLANLQVMYLQGNRLSGCIPEGLRDGAYIDIEDLDLPFCASRSIREGAAAGSNVGNPVVATDDGEGDTLTYTLGGADATLFDIDSSTGQITVGVGTQLDYETKDRYDVTVTTTDPSSGASDTITVVIMVTDVRVSEDAAVNAYDANTNETIEKSEMIDAILDYLNYEIEKGLVLDLIRLLLWSHTVLHAHSWAFLLNRGDTPLRANPRLIRRPM